MKFDPKSLLLGVVIGIFGVSSISLAANDPEVQKIESAFSNNSKVYFYNQEVPLTNPLIEVYNTEDSTTQLYMPAEDVLEYLNFDVDWSRDNNTISLTMKNSAVQSESVRTELSTDLSLSELESNAIDLITKTGNWNYIEPYLYDLSDDVIKKIVSIYNSKHHKASEHKNASDYMHD